MQRFASQLALRSSRLLLLPASARRAALLCAAVAAGAPAFAQQSWELGCSVEGPKMLSLPVLADPSDAGSAVVAQRAYAYLVATVENSGKDPAPLALTARVLPLDGDLPSARASAALVAQDAVIAAIRAAEGNEELIDLYRAGSTLEEGADAKLVVILARDVIAVGADGAPKRAFAFPASYDLVLGGLKHELSSADGRVVAQPHDWVARGSYADGAFELGGGEFRAVEGVSGVDLGPAQERWGREQIQDFLDAWTLDVEVHRPRSVLVTEPPASATDLRSVQERTRAFWYVRLRVANRGDKARPLALTTRVFTRKSYDIDDRLLRELEDPNLHPTRRRIYEQQIQQRLLLPIRNADAFRAAAAQEVERYGAIYGPVDFFALPKTISPLVETEGALREMLRSGPTGAFDVIVLLSDALDPGVTEFEIRVGGTRNQIEWLNPESRKPEGDFHTRELFRIAEEIASRFRRKGSDAILDDPFELSSQRWVRLNDGKGLKAIDLVEPVKVGG
ncbi:MAG: hypothetical protein IPN34_06490 [Planctomycetes bacterium]|nr:hypothetical protein [Planctomycetota bacterium]